MIERLEDTAVSNVILVYLAISLRPSNIRSTTRVIAPPPSRWSVNVHHEQRRFLRAGAIGASASSSINVHGDNQIHNNFADNGGEKLVQNYRTQTHVVYEGGFATVG